jgi:hypothetical protein
MGKLFIGDVEPSSLGAIDKLYVGAELVWPSEPVPGWQNGNTTTNLTFGGTNGAVVNISPAPNGTLTVQSVAPVTGGDDTLNGFAYFLPVATDVTLGRFFRVVNDASPGFPSAWQAIASFYFPVPLQMAVDAGTPTAFQSGRFEFSETNGGPIVATVGYNITLNYAAATSGYQSMNGARVESRSGSANNLSAQLAFLTSGSVDPSVTGGTMSAFGVRNWWFGTPLPATTWVRFRVASQSGGTLAFTRNNGGNVAANTWFDLNAANGVTAVISSSGSSAYNRFANVEIDFATSNGGPVLSTSTFTLRVVKT